MKIILASGSPRRRELLEQAGYDFTVEVSDADENIEADSPAELVEELSFRKAMAVVAHYERKDVNEAGDQYDVLESGDKNDITESLIEEQSDQKDIVDVRADEITIIGADTVVALEGDILGKPDGEHGAVLMLRELSGNTHQVYTGVSLILLHQGQVMAKKSFHVCTDVTMRELTEEEIAGYVSTGEPMDKAGAYGIQGKAAVFISGICGDYYNVVGLPLCKTVQELEMLWHENGMQR